MCFIDLVFLFILYFLYRYGSSAEGENPDRYFHQRMGIPMGGNTSYIYADLYMRYHIGRVMPRLRKMGLLLIKKYVDDFLCYAPRGR